MKQVIIINGGSCYDSYQKYLDELKSMSVDISAFKPKIDWKSNLQDNLGPDFEILSPTMPNKHNADYEEWKIWFEKIFPFVGDGVILVGHSLGGIFLAKYLSENKFPQVIEKLLLVASPFDSDLDESLKNFVLGDDFKLLQEQASNIFIYSSKDDRVVPFAHAQKYQEILPKAKLIVFEDRGHFSKMTDFPELLAEIRSNIK